jgi:hypothetical protein
MDKMGPSRAMEIEGPTQRVDDHLSKDQLEKLGV